MASKFRKKRSGDVRRLVATSVDQVPDGYVPLSDFNSNHTLHKAISAAPLTTIRLMKWDTDVRTGTVFIEPSELKDFLAHYEGGKKGACSTVGALSVKACALPRAANDHADHETAMRIDRIEGKVDGLVEQLSSLMKQLT